MEFLFHLDKRQRKRYNKGSRNKGSSRIFIELSDTTWPALFFETFGYPSTYQLIIHLKTSRHAGIVSLS